jgi:hypothetical protein
LARNKKSYGHDRSLKLYLLKKMRKSFAFIVKQSLQQTPSFLNSSCSFWDKSRASIEIFSGVSPGENFFARRHLIKRHFKRILPTCQAQTQTRRDSR